MQCLQAIAAPAQGLNWSAPAPRHRTATGHVIALAIALMLVATQMVVSDTALAQSAQPQPQVYSGPATATRPAQPAKTAAAKPATAKPADAASSAETKGSDGSLRGRVDQLEEQFADVQVTLGTLESLARTAGTQASSATYRAGPSGAAISADGTRVDALESELRSLSADVRRLSDEVRALRGQPLAAPAGAYQPSGGTPRAASSPIEREVVAAAPVIGAPAGAAPGLRPAPVAGFGQTTVQPAPARDPIASVLGAQAASTSQATAGPGPLGTGTAKQSFDTAYGYLLQQDYGAAQTAFEDYLQRFPNDELAGNGQYLLGETYYQRSQFRPAAGAYLKGYQTYPNSTKAPDSLFKLAMSMDRLGEKDAACSSYIEFGTRFPNAPSTLKVRTDNERRRLGC